MNIEYDGYCHYLEKYKDFQCENLENTHVRVR